MINKYDINGPINIIRLENKQLNKVIYLLGDYHLNPNQQFKCDNYESLDIDKLLYKFLKKTNDYNDKKWDILFEGNIFNIDKNNIKLQSIKYSNRYIDSIKYLILKYFNYNIKKDNKLDVHKSSTFDNIRFHYIDIRYHNLNYLYELNSNRKYKWNIEMTTILDLIKKNILTDINSLYNKNDTITDKFFYKILNQYNNSSNQTKISNIVNNILLPYSKKIINIIESIKKYITNKEKKIFLKKNNGNYYKNISILKEKINILYDDIENFYAMFMDLYTIRRIIDKKYNTNSILYAGLSHCINIINILVKNFDFNITHTHFKEVSVNELNKRFKNEEYNYNNMNLQNLLLPEYLTQCTNMKKFPDMFL